MVKKKNIFVVLFLVLAMIPISSGYDPIEDNDMQALVWCSLDEGQVWVNDVERIETKLLAAGFNVTMMFDPSPDDIYEFIEHSNDVKIYYGLGHGNDWSANTGDGYVRGYLFQDAVETRNPITISTFQHCGDFECYNDNRWLQAGTCGNDNVTARRYYGYDWCVLEAMKLGIDIVPTSTPDCINNTKLCIILGADTTNITYGIKSFDIDSVFQYLDAGYTYADADDMTYHWGEPGKKQGNQDLRYPQYCGDVDYDMDVDQNDVILISNHLNNSTIYPVHSEWDADVNGDMVVDESDLALLNRHVNNPDRYPLHPRGWFIDETWELYDADNDGMIDTCERTDAVIDYFAHLITLEVVNAVIAAHDIPVCEKYDTESPFDELSIGEVVNAINDNFNGCLDTAGTVAVVTCFYSQ